MAKLAIKGGSKIRSKPFPQWPVWDKREGRNLLEVLESGAWSVFGGSKVDQFQNAFAEQFGAKYAVAANNGTSTLMMSLKAVGVEPGDEVIVPAYTFLATASAALFCHAIPVFADIDFNTFCLSVDSVRAKITDRTKAIIPVHLGGRPADMDGLMALARERKLKVVEDCAQAHGSEWRGKRVGTLGDVGSFSFQASKNMTSAEGGVVITNDVNVARLAWSYHNCGRMPGGAWYGHERLGWNLRMTEFEAAILLVQLTRLDEQTQRRHANGRYLDAQLSGIPGVRVLSPDPRITVNGYHLYVFSIDRDEFDGVDRDLFVRALAAEGIPCMTGYVPLYKEPCFGNPHGDAAKILKAMGRPDIQYGEIYLPSTERACKEGVWLPQTVLLGSDDDMRDVVGAVAKIRENAAELAGARA